MHEKEVYKPQPGDYGTPRLSGGDECTASVLALSGSSNNVKAHIIVIHYAWLGLISHTVITQYHHYYLLEFWKLKGTKHLPLFKVKLLYMYNSKSLVFS